MLIEAEAEADFEIVLGLVCPIGTDLEAVIATISDQLRVYKYESEVIRLSHLLDRGTGKETPSYFKERMDAGDQIRSQIQSGDAVAALAIGKILELRDDDRRVRKAWILRTLKHDEEVSLLRSVFGPRFILIGVSQSKAVRTQNLIRKFKGSSEKKSLIGEVEELIARDEMDETTVYGQRVRETYAKSDYFLDLNNDIVQECVRLTGVLFGAPFLTPSRDEVAMAHAHTASLRSADPGRQVGAVITNHHAEVIAIGSNEVPKHGGGEYWSGDESDARDFAMGVDFNKREIMNALGELLEVLDADGHLASGLLGLSSQKRLEQVWDASRARLKSTRVMSLIEFGRVVHAEMSALMAAARSTVSVRGGTIYTTAFPCHMCMKLIIAAGLSRIVYVDPYPKSLALEMYQDSIVQDGPSTERDRSKVQVDSFSGASWNIYGRVFRDHNRDRDDFGAFRSFDKTTARFLLADQDPLLRAKQLENEVASALRFRAEMSEQETKNASETETGE